MHHTAYSTSVNFFQDQTKKRQYHTEQVGVGMGLHLQGLRFLRGIFLR